MDSSNGQLDAYAASAGAAVACAIGVSLCCIGPLVLLALGVGSVHLIDAIAPYRPWIVGGELAAYAVYRALRPAPSCDADGPPSAFKQIAFWIALFVVVGGIVALAV